MYAQTRGIEQYWPFCTKPVPRIGEIGSMKIKDVNLKVWIIIGKVNILVPQNIDYVGKS